MPTSNDLGSRTLRQGNKGQDVVELQTMLNGMGASLVVDGSFGRATFAAVKNYQSSHGLTSDGVVGPPTWQSLLTKAPSPETPSNAILARYETGSTTQTTSSTKSSKPSAMSMGLVMGAAALVVGFMAFLVSKPKKGRVT